MPVSLLSARPRHHLRSLMYFAASAVASVDVAAGSSANGTGVQLYDCNGTGAQKWRHQSNGALLNPASGGCLDATVPSSANGTRLQIWDCTGSVNQQWNLPR